MPKIGNYKESHEMPCKRCGGKKKVSKKWKEKIENAGGFMVLEHTKIICTNKVCQVEFEQKLIEEEEKREKAKLARTNGSAANKK